LLLPHQMAEMSSRRPFPQHCQREANEVEKGLKEVEVKEEEVKAKTETEAKIETGVEAKMEEKTKKEVEVAKVEAEAEVTEVGGGTADNWYNNAYEKYHVVVLFSNLIHLLFIIYLMGTL
jgi:hypothetical protein